MHASACALAAPPAATAGSFGITPRVRAVADRSDRAGGIAPRLRDADASALPRARAALGSRLPSSRLRSKPMMRARR